MFDTYELCLYSLLITSGDIKYESETHVRQYGDGIFGCFKG